MTTIYNENLVVIFYDADVVSVTRNYDWFTVTDIVLSDTNNWIDRLICWF